MLFRATWIWFLLVEEPLEELVLVGASTTLVAAAGATVKTLSDPVPLVSATGRSSFPTGCTAIRVDSTVLLKCIDPRGFQYT